MTFTADENEIKIPLSNAQTEIDFDGVKVSGSDESKYQNWQFEITVTVELIGKKFETNQQIRCALLNILEGVKASAKINGNGLANVFIVVTQSGSFTIGGNSHGNISEINGIAGSVEGNFENAISVNGKAIRLTDTSSIKVTSDGERITEISNVAGDSDGIYRKDVRVYELGGAGEIIISDKTLSTSDDFIGVLGLSSEGLVDSVEDFIGTISGELGGIKLAGVTIDNEDNFNVTSNSEKITTLENLQDGSFTCGDLSGLTINGATISVANSKDFTAPIIAGELNLRGLKDSAIVENSGAAVNYTVEESGDFLIGETEFKLTGDTPLTFTTDADGIVQEISNLDENASLQTAQDGSFVVNGTTFPFRGCHRLNERRFEWPAGHSR